jgi:putative tryptophan/tyrosine transport system substrate-binding protein
MTDRRSFLKASLAAATCTPIGAAAQPAARKLPRVAYVWLFNEGPSAPYQGAFRLRMEELGWVDSKTFTVEYRNANGDPRKLASIMDELVRTNVDVIVAMCTPEAIAARKVTTTIPIVVASVGDPVMAGLVTNLRRPDTNVTGVSAVLLPLSAKRMELLRETSAGVKKAAVVWNPARKDNEPEVKIMQEAGRRVGIELQSFPVRSREEFATAMDFMETEGVHALLNCGDNLVTHEGPAMVAKAARMRIPAVYESRYFVDIGGFMSYGPNFRQLHQTAAGYVDKILRGAKPADLPIEEPKRFELVVNRKAAAAMGLAIPHSILLRADDVIG